MSRLIMVKTRESNKLIDFQRYFKKTIKKTVKLKKKKIAKKTVFKAHNKKTSKELKRAAMPTKYRFLGKKQPKIDGFETFRKDLGEICMSLLTARGSSERRNVFKISDEVAAFLRKKPYSLDHSVKDSLQLLRELKIETKLKKRERQASNYWISEFTLRFVKTRSLRFLKGKNLKPQEVLINPKLDFFLKKNNNEPQNPDSEMIAAENDIIFGSFHASDTEN